MSKAHTPCRFQAIPNRHKSDGSEGVVAYGKGLGGDASLVPKMRKPFGVVAQGPFASDDNRGDKTPLELCIAGVRGWEAYPRRLLDDGKPVAHVA